jgi:hypothetical protein
MGLTASVCAGQESHAFCEAGNLAGGGSEFRVYAGPAAHALLPPKGGTPNAHTGFPRHGCVDGSEAAG